VWNIEIKRSNFTAGGITFYYLWTGSSKKARIIYLGIEKTKIGQFLEESKKKKYGNNDICISDEKFRSLEYKISGYLKKNIKDIDLEPLFITGSIFDRKVWNITRKVPFGKTSDYSSIASATGSPRACRAAGNALGRNPLIIIVPCHRIIKSSGEIGGFSCGAELKKKFLDIEGIRIND
jgi:methylated-DNA-[protein]-cysteine S-methyltransferase